MRAEEILRKLPSHGEWKHHRTMLEDQVRLSIFKSSLQAKLEGHEAIVDIGSGTGVLSFLAAELGAKKVTGIEANSKIFQFAKDICTDKQSVVRFINRKSFEVSLDGQDAPTLLVSETLGQLGPEEHIVEICYDFCRRHQTVQELIPSKLSLFCQPVALSNAETFAAQEKDVCLGSRAELVSQSGPSFLMKSYKLGLDWDSSFDFSLDISHFHRANAAHFYFVAELTKNFNLSTHYTMPLTHWMHAYAQKIDQRNILRVSYKAGSSQVLISWS